MAVTHTATVRSGLANYICDQLDNGTIELCNSSDVAVCILGFSANAFAAASNGTATANQITPGTSVSGGTIAKGIVKTSGGTELFRFVVATSNGDLNLSNLTLSPNDQVQLTNFAYVAPL